MSRKWVLHVKWPKILFTMQWLVLVKSAPEDGTKIEIQREISKLLAHQRQKRDRKVAA